MSETFPHISHEHKEPTEPDYGRAIQYALDGYAKDGVTWLRGRHAFHEAMEKTGLLDTALRNALYVASRGAESTYEEATSKFWNLVEGEDGNHARYSLAIKRALDGYAKDGDSWLFARDVFFDVLGQNGDVKDALSRALTVISGEAESSEYGAEGRFWQEVDSSASKDALEAVAADSNVEEATYPTLEIVGVWPDETVDIGGLTSKIEHSEAEQIFEHVEIRGDGRAGELTPELLERVGLLPRHRIEIENRTIWFSPGYSIRGGRIAVIGYVQDDDGSVVARSYYRSNSQGVWRYLPQYKMKEGSLSWYSKGYGEESVTLPAKLQEGLTRAVNDDGGILVFDHDTTQAVFSGTARYVNSEGTVYHRDVVERPVRVKGVPEAEWSQLPPPETVRPDYEQAPRFEHILSSWQQETGLYGRVTYEVIPSNDGMLRYVFSRDEQGRAWISSIENDSPLESTGLRRKWVSGGALVTPAEEYLDHSGGYGVVKHARGGYADMFDNYLSKMPVIRDYLAFVESRQD